MRNALFIVSNQLTFYARRYALAVSVLCFRVGGECATDQVLYNLKNRGVEYDLIPWCASRRMPVMAYTPLGEGRLRDDSTLACIARRHGATPVQVMLAWVMRGGNVVAIPKASSVAHVEENAKSLGLTLAEDELRRIDAAFPPPSGKVPLAGW